MDNQRIWFGLYKLGMDVKSTEILLISVSMYIKNQQYDMGIGREGGRNTD
jgi:hypothetical protein